jgi:hypothetical protein
MRESTLRRILAFAKAQIRWTPFFCESLAVGRPARSPWHAQEHQELAEQHLQHHSQEGEEGLACLGQCKQQKYIFSMSARNSVDALQKDGRETTHQQKDKAAEVGICQGL